MSEAAKITLSEKELELVCNTDWILTKHVVIDKVYQLFGRLASSMQLFVEENKENLPDAVLATNPKISRGENYRQLPYVMLDYPRLFTSEDSFAIRTLFWWGNFFSVNLQLSGHSKQDAVPALIAAFIQLQQQDYWLCINEDPWQHHFNEDNYLPVTEFSLEDFAAILHNGPFIKIAKKIPLSHWDNATHFINDTFREMIKMLAINFRGDEKGLSPGIPTTGFDL
ncbi:MAG: hypothetical protein ABIN67_12045 [Ferruginibacter sp.]